MISGATESGHRQVREEFQRKFASRKGVGVACPVSVHKKLVVDL